MAGLRDRRAFSTRRTVAPIAALLSILLTLVFSAAGGGAPGLHFHFHSGGPVYSHPADGDCARKGAGEAPAPACPAHPHCCLIGSVAASPPEAFGSAMVSWPEAGEALAIGVVVEIGDRRPEPSRPWSSRGPPRRA